MKKWLAVVLVTSLFFPLESTAQEESDLTIDTVLVEGSGVTDEKVDNVVYFDYLQDSFRANKRQVADTTWTRLKAQKEYWYANAANKDSTLLIHQRKKGKGSQQNNETVIQPTEETDSSENWSSGWLFYILLAAFVGLLLWFLYTSGEFGLWRKKSNQIDEVNETVEEDIYQLNFKGQIQKAEEAGDWRLATRLWYLSTLKELSDRNLIQYTQEKTNQEYVSELYNTRHYAEFFKLTRSFDYVWYGMFPITEEAYGQLVRSFTIFQQQLT